MLRAVLAKRPAFQAVDALNAMDVGALEDFAEDHVTCRFPGRTDMSGRVEGKQAVVAWFRRWFDRPERLRFVPRHVCVERIFTCAATNTVVVVWEVEVTPVGGETYHATSVTVFEARRGKSCGSRTTSSSKNGSTRRTRPPMPRRPTGRDERTPPASGSELEPVTPPGHARAGGDGCPSPGSPG
jgi:hypothetical protein